MAAAMGAGVRLGGPLSDVRGLGLLTAAGTQLPGPGILPTAQALRHPPHAPVAAVSIAGVSPVPVPTKAPEPTVALSRQAASAQSPLPSPEAALKTAAPQTASPAATLQKLGVELDRQTQAKESGDTKTSLDAVFLGLRRTPAADTGFPVAAAAGTLRGTGAGGLTRPIQAEPAAAVEVPPALPQSGGARERIAGSFHRAVRTAGEMFFGEAELAALRRPYLGKMNFSRFILIFQAVMGTALSYATGHFIDAAMASAGPLALAWFGGMAALTVARILIGRTQWMLNERIKLRMRQDFRMAFFNHVQRLPASSAKRGDAPEITMRLLYDVGKVTTKNADIPLQMPMLVIQFVMAAAFVLNTSLPLAMGIMISLPLLAYLSAVLGRKMAARQKQISLEQADLTRLGQDLFEGSRDALAGGGDAHAASVYGGRSNAYEALWLEVTKLSANYCALRDFLQAVFSEMLILGAGFLFFILTGYPTVGQIMSLRGYAGDLRGAFTGILDRYNDGRSADGGMSRIYELLREAALAPDKPGAKDFSGSEVSFRGVRYSLPGKGEVLSGADFSARPGERVLVVGGDALARRSLADLLFRLDAPAAGSVHAGGADVADLRRQSLVGRTALVSGKAAAFAGTLRENLLFGVPRMVEDAAILEALRAAGAASLLDPSRLPKGLDTTVQDAGGVSLDAEQRQRLALARAVLKDPAVLVSEDLGLGLVSGEADGLRKDFEALSRGRTTLVFAGLAENGEAYDRIVVLHEGAVVESGTHAELMALGGRYKTLAEASRPAIDIINDHVEPNPPHRRHLIPDRRP